jgi:hypothetical protein
MHAGAVVTTGASSCTDCTAGKVDDDTVATTDCTDCPPGSQAAPGQTVCLDCSPGMYDHDADPSTPCDHCPPGSVSVASGAFGPALPLAQHTNTSCALCGAGKFNPNVGSTAADACQVCAPGTFAAMRGEQACEACPAGTFRSGLWIGEADRLALGLADAASPALEAAPPGWPAATRVDVGAAGVDAATPWIKYAALFTGAARIDCQPCQAFKELSCSDPGMPFPKAAPGYYAKEKTDTALTVATAASGGSLQHAVMPLFSECAPFKACTGSCPASVQEAEAPDYAACPGAVGAESCIPGYTSERCSECVAMGLTSDELDSFECDGTAAADPLNAGLGFYRIDGRCERCPCSWVKLRHIVAFCVVGLLTFLALIDWLTKQVEHVSTILAPVMIVVTFCQTLALLLDLGFPWPPQLRELLRSLSVFNVNMELARPECSMQVTFAHKLQMTLLMPICVFLLIGLLIGVKWISAKCQGEEKFMAKNKGVGSAEALSQQALMLASSFFVVCAIFFLRTVFNGLNCQYDSGSQQHFLVIEPEVICDADLDPRYAEIRLLAVIGLAGFAGVFVAFCLGLTVKPDLFEFLGDKFEGKWYYWEMTLVVRKVGLMASFLFFAATPEQGWYFGSFVIIVSVIVHAFARPFEDYLIDVCEFFSLVAVLFVFQSGIVFKILNDPENPDSSSNGLWLATLMERISLVLVLLNCVVAVFIEARVLHLVIKEEEDYKVGLWRERLVQLESEVEQAKQYIAENELKRDDRLEKQAEGCRTLFGLLDKDNSGFLDKEEVKKLCKEMGRRLGAQQLDDAMAEMDADGSGKVEFEEFEQWWGQQKGGGGGGGGGGGDGPSIFGNPIHDMQSVDEESIEDGATSPGSKFPELEATKK